MARMIDNLLAGKLVPPTGRIPATPTNLRLFREYGEQVKPQMSMCPIIVADNVAEYLYAGTDQEVWRLGSDFPGMAPPFEQFWIEYRRPRTTRSEGKVIVEPIASRLRFGAYFEAHSVESIKRVWREETGRMQEAFSEQVSQSLSFAWARDGASIERKWRECGEDPAKLWAALSENERLTIQTARAAHQMEGVENVLPEAAAWTMTAMTYIEWDIGGKFPLIAGPCEMFAFVLDSAGNPLAEPQCSVPMLRGLDLDPHAPQLNPSEMNLGPSLFAACLALSFMNCKNVRKVINEPDAPLSRKFEKRHGRPLQRFYTLQIEAMGEILRKEGKSEETGLRKALHICRGHFSDYSEGKGLFGKYHGRYWVPSHIRGKRAFGTVEKDYEVGSPSKVLTGDEG